MSDVPALEVLVEGHAPGDANMRRDIELLDACAAAEIPGAVRIYGFSPACLSLGRMQPLSDVDTDACARDGVDVVRRPSGGRAVLHDQEVTYAVVCAASDPHFGGRVLESCARIHAVVGSALRALGVDTLARERSRDARADARFVAGAADCFARPAAHELLDRFGNKVVGSAQARRGRALLQHGSILLESPRASLYLRDAAATAGAAPTAGGGLRPLLTRDVSWEEAAASLAAAFRTAVAAELDTPG